MNHPGWNAFTVGAFTAGLGVLLGAFGAHALSALPAANLAWWSTATQYLFIAAFGMMLHGIFERTQLTVRSPSAALLIGITLFSGSLYAMALGAPRWLGMVTPLGGVSLVVGFLWMGWRAWRAR